METNRLKHSLAVATKMKMLAAQYYCSPEDAFVLGFLHDIGYEFCKEDHAVKGGEILKEQGYKYWKEVQFHGKVQDEYNSRMLRLLNFADMTTGPSGEEMTMEQRVEDIAKRYGVDSKQEKDAKALLKSKIK